MIMKETNTLRCERSWHIINASSAIPGTHEMSGLHDLEGLPYMGDARTKSVKEQLLETNTGRTRNSSKDVKICTMPSAEFQEPHIPKSFCWGCCFHCSCMSMKRQEDIPEPLTQNTDDQTSNRLTIDEVLSWKQSFEKLISSEVGKIVFREFLRTEYSEENLLFWMACEDLRKLETTNEDIIEDKARTIYEDYISILSPKEVSLDARVRDIINENMIKPSPKTFDEAQMQIYTLMHRDSYPRFLASPVFKKYLDSVGAG